MTKTEQIIIERHADSGKYGRPEEYKPAQARTYHHSPQTDPTLFTDAEIMSEIKYLIRLNKRYGTHVLRVQAYLELARVVEERRIERGECVQCGEAHNPVSRAMGDVCGKCCKKNQREVAGR